jgi:hypothetical protein
MRRLTKFEKDIVKQINETNIVRFENIEAFISLLYKKEFALKFEKLKLTVGEKIGISVLYSPEVSDINYGEAFGKVLEFYQRIIQTIHLLDLLVENRLISYKIVNSNFSDNLYYLNEEFVKQLSDLKEAYIDANDDISILEKLANRYYYPNEALHIYVKNGFRTEEQKQNDFNRWVGWFTLGAAVIGLLLTGIFSWLTYEDTKDRHKIEDRRYNEEAIAEANKDSLNVFYRNEVILRIDKIAKEVELNNKVVPVKPVD